MVAKNVPCFMGGSANKSAVETKWRCKGYGGEGARGQAPRRMSTMSERDLLAHSLDFSLTDTGMKTLKA